MSSFEALLRLDGETGPPLGVEVDLTDARMNVKTGEVELADWNLDEIRVTALEDGFHIRAEGETVVLDVTKDAEFAVELGLTSAHPDLRKRMSRLLRNADPHPPTTSSPSDDPGVDVEGL
jgi:hypothetical protein